MRPDLDHWLARPLVRVTHRREADAPAAELWAAAATVTIGDTRALGRLVRLRIPGLTPGVLYDDMFRSAPFNVLAQTERSLVSGLVGRIWTLRRDYPALARPEDFRGWSARGTVRVMFGSWVEDTPSGGSALTNEARIDAVDRGARIGLATLRPLITRSHSLIDEGLEVAVSRVRPATGGPPPD